MNGIYAIPEVGVTIEICPICGKEFRATPGWVYKARIKGKGKSKKMCSYSCLVKAEMAGKKVEDNRRQNCGKKTKVICVESGVVYDSMLEAANATYSSAKCISACCRGAMKSANGMHWRYAEEG